MYPKGISTELHSPKTGWTGAHTPNRKLFTFVTEDEFDRVVDPAKMVHPYVAKAR